LPVGDPAYVHVAIVTDPIDVAALIRRVSDDGVGAVSIFLGTVRDLNDGRAVTGIDYEAYQPMAESELRAIADEAVNEAPGLRLAVEHRIGSLQVGEISVAIAASHARRAPALDGARSTIERLKVRVPIWKQEHYVEGDRAWIDPTAVAADTARA
jgi:molybdopterin synthase catalytic subunit